MYYKDPKSFLIVLVQLILMFSLLSAGPIFPQNLASFILIVSGSVLGLSSAWIISTKSRFNVFPDALAGANLITSGPYKYIRHPIYSALILGGLGLFLNDLSIFRLVLVILLSCLLIYKMNVEEYFLSQMFSGYKDYAKKTSRLFPGLY